MKDLIITINANTRNALFTRNFIGVNGEYLDGYIKVDFEDEFIDGIATFEFERSDGKYYIEMEKGDDDFYYLQIKSSLLSKAEKLKCQIRIDQAGEEVFKCRRFPLFVLTAVNSATTIPEDYGDWLSHANQKLLEIDEAIDDAEEATTRANAISQDLETKRDNDYYRGETGNGIASVAKTGTSGNVDTYTITFTDGTTFSYTVTNADDGTYRVEIDEINSKIPAQASANNKLVDTDKMNSSIATNTANFIGTFANVSALNNYSGTITNNDYAFVENSVLSTDFADFTALNLYDKTLLTNFDYAWVINGTNFDLYRFDITTQTWSMKAQNVAKADVTLNTAFNRYKATVSGTPATTTWGYEFTLNNSSFTADQWASINSGITAGKVAEFENKQDKIDANHKLNADLVNDNSSSNKFMSSNTIKSVFGVELSASGELKAKIKTGQDYIDLWNDAFISKGTLEGVKSGIEDEIQSLLSTSGDTTQGSSTVFQCSKRIGNLIFKFGTGSVTTTANDMTSKTVNFDTPFPNACLCQIVVGQTTASTARTFTSYATKNTTSITAGIYRTNAVLTYFNWLAIGY